MALIFELWAECRDSQGLSRLAEHFCGVSHTLLSGRTIAWAPAIVGPPHYVPGLSVCMPGLSNRGVRTVSDALEVTEAGLRAYHHLLGAPPFCYARVEWEAANIPMSDLPDFVSTLATGERRLSLSCVTDSALWEELGRPMDFTPFRPGYVWRPYGGESYRPLGSNDHPELWRLRNELFPC